MHVFFHKEIQAFEYVSFSELKLNSKSDFCCKKFEKYVSSVKSWNGKIGKYSIVEKENFVPIDFCPFCGKKMEYISVE